ncbi:MAG: hypothetical protein EBW96_02710, partial [Actinobacteria bacterium]|nr:hypothetical protein [Actinomycetota bacterium]
ALKKDKLVAKYIPESAERLPARFKDKDGYWVATNLYVLSPGFNTDLVKKGTEPKTFQDLLDPKWRGKIAWNSSVTPFFSSLVLIAGTRCPSLIR